jgi:Domain of unknown function (DUF1841)
VIFSSDRERLRRMYNEAWRKHTGGQPLSPLEAQIADIVAEHPEYHGAITDNALDRDFLPEGGQANPYLHMGLHLALREQVATDRPPGIRRLHQRILGRTGDLHDGEHRMIECLAETLWEAQSANCAPDEARYLERLRQLTGDGL